MPKENLSVSLEEVSFTNDVYFKYLLGGNDVRSTYVRNEIIKAVTGISVKLSEVLNPEIVPDLEEKNKIVMDVRVRDEEGREYDIEMQMYGSTKTENMRFQYYITRMLSNQAIEKSHYECLKPVYGIIFMDRIQSKRLINHHQMKDDDGDPTIGLMIHMYVISLDNINEVKEEKGIQGMTAFEKLCYLFKNGRNDDILDIGERLVTYTMEKRAEMSKLDDIWDYAKAKEIGKIRHDLIIQDKYEEGLEEGEKKGIEKGIEQGIEQGKIDSIQKLMVLKYQTDAIEWLHTLSNQQLDQVMELILSYDSLDEIKKTIA